MQSRVCFESATADADPSCVPARRCATDRTGITASDTVAFGPLGGLDAELFDRDLRAFAGRKVLGLLGATVTVEAERLTVHFPLAT